MASCCGENPSAALLGAVSSEKSSPVRPEMFSKRTESKLVACNWIFYDILPCFKGYFVSLGAARRFQKCLAGGQPV